MSPSIRVQHSTRANNRREEWLGSDDLPLPTGWLAFVVFTDGGEGDPFGPFNTEADAIEFGDALLKLL